MKINNRRIAAALPAAILALGVCLAANARAAGVEEVPDMNEAVSAPSFGFEALSPAMQLDNLNVPGNPDLPSTVSAVQAGLGAEVSAAPIEAGTAAESLPVQAAVEQGPSGALPASVAAPAAASQPGEVAGAPAQARQVAGEVLQAVNGSKDLKVNSAGFDGGVAAQAEGAPAVEAAPEVAARTLPEQVKWAQDTMAEVRKQWDKVIVGQEESKDAMETALIANSHAYLESAPGLGKTTLAKAVADSISANFRRVQGTADLLPADIIGNMVPKKNEKGEIELVFEKGPIFTDILLFDEINRAPPKTLSAVLEAMEERQVTVMGKTYKLPPHFTVFATQNPLEEQGVFPTPYAAQDRFLGKVPVSKPTEQELVKIIALNRDSSAKPKAQVITNLETLDQIRKVALRLTVSPEIQSYIARIIEAANSRSEIKAGHVISPRAAIGIEMAARIHALKRGETAVYPEDVEAVVPLVLRHRLIIDYSAESEGVTSDKLIQKILAEVKIGGARPAGK
ncbi:MAG: MoxR family ATPase [Elusimicrobia bacterium]|nr:MoxR family ATPase [Elusimicrobiota bacterium]MDE2313447.1 MoxR family ATPase [Elusimicrobiota bacterium]